MYSDLGVPAVRLLNNEGQLLLGEGLIVAQLAVANLDEVHPVLDLAAHLGGHALQCRRPNARLVLRQLAEGCGTVADAADGGQETLCAKNAGPFEQARVNSISHRDIREPLAAGTGEAGHPRM